MRPTGRTGGREKRAESPSAGQIRDGRDRQGTTDGRAGAAKGYPAIVNPDSNTAAVRGARVPEPVDVVGSDVRVVTTKRLPAGCPTGLPTPRARRRADGATTGGRPAGLPANDRLEGAGRGRRADEREVADRLPRMERRRARRAGRAGRVRGVTADVEQAASRAAGADRRPEDRRENCGSSRLAAWAKSART